DFGDLLGEASEGTRRVARIVQDLKDFTRVDRAEVGEVDLAEAVRTAARLAEGRLPAGACLEVEAPAPLPVWADGGAVHQALWHLVENALWAVGQGGSRVGLACGRDGGEAWLEVADDGPGVAEECLPLLFEPFYTTKPVGEGAGLGLTVVHDVARAHGGRVDVAAAPGAGARFRLVLSVSGGRP
ncbi:MAG: sensor histidine kinase, partial [Deferrisomatales bacterium]